MGHSAHVTGRPNKLRGLRAFVAAFIALTFLLLPVVSVSASTTSPRPSAPRDVRALAGEVSAKVTFRPPASKGIGRITRYDVEVFPTKRIYACRLTDCKVRGLTNGDTYFFRVAAVNKFGTGPSSLSSNKVTPHISMAKVSFTPNGGAGTMANETENYNVATGLSPNDFTLTGYTFTGWNTAANGTGVAYVNGASYAFTASATLYAQWTINAYIVTFSANFPHPSGGAGTMAIETENYNVATGLSPNDFTLTGYTFTGWNTAANGTGAAYANDASYAFTANATLYAQWSANIDTVTFNSNFPLTGGGSGSMSIENFTSGTAQALTINVFAATGYTFTGWNTLANGTGVAYVDGAVITIYANVALYAQWTINSYTVTFNPNFPQTVGGLGSMANETENYDVSASLTANAFTFTGYTFNGWNTAANGTGVAYPNSATWVFTANTTLYAQWLVVSNPAPQVGTPSYNWSGYVLSGNSTVFTQVSGGWQVPFLNCSDIPTSESATWVGTGGTLGEVLLQTGTENSCVNGSQQEVGWYELYPSTPNQEVPFTHFPVNPGDSMFATVTDSNGQWETILEDLTSGRMGIFKIGVDWQIESISNNSLVYFSQTTDSSQTYSGATSAEWIMEDPFNGSTNTYFPFANYGTVTFTSLGTDLGVPSLPYSDSYYIIQSNVTLSLPTQVSGNSFTCRYTGP